MRLTYFLVFLPSCQIVFSAVLVLIILYSVDRIYSKYSHYGSTNTVSIFLILLFVIYFRSNKEIHLHLTAESLRVSYIVTDLVCLLEY